MTRPLSLEWTLGGADAAPALGFPDGRTLSYGELRNRVMARPALEAGSSLPLSNASPDAQLVDALAAWNAGAVVAAGGTDHAHPLDPRAALLLFTSGSTGARKGVLLSAEGIRANVEAILTYLPVREVPDTALVLPLHYSYALVGQALTTLHAGGTLWLLSDLQYPRQKLEAMARVARPVGLSSVPASLRLLARTQAEQRLPLTLGYVASAGGRLERPLVELVRQAFGHVRFFNQYGLTEASPRVTAVSDDEPAFAFGSVGRPLPGITVFAAGPNGDRLPTGAMGELAVRGPSVMLGYLGSEKGLLPDGTLLTGDLGHVDRDGYVFVAGRRDGLVKVAGERVHVDAVARAFRIEGVREVQIVALPDEALGARLIAVVEAEPGLMSALRARGRLVDAHARPARYVIVPSMPRTPNGKIDLTAVRRLAEGA